MATAASAISDDLARRLTRRAKQEHDVIIAKRLIGTDAVELIEADAAGRRFQFV
ncbi:hypothetical protein [Bradyrhizobium cytisi]|uniref:hypothetical protein n=1 Tax=Bradyrhizobium cytisi TaxID=515489 RepID=UPI001652CFDE|nr:hypothetical protein [Bradyrhizobium cytisi]